MGLDNIGVVARLGRCSKHHHANGLLRMSPPADALGLHSGIYPNDPLRAIDGEHHSVLDGGSAYLRPYDAGHAVLSRDYGAVAEDSSSVRDDGAGDGE